jgi:hypothetical protein
MTTEQPVDLHKHDRWIQSTHEFTKKVSLVLRMLKYVSHYSSILMLVFFFFFFLNILCRLYEIQGNEDIFSLVIFFFFIWYC